MNLLLRRVHENGLLRAATLLALAWAVGCSSSKTGGASIDAGSGADARSAKHDAGASHLKDASDARGREVDASDASRAHDAPGDAGVDTGPPAVRRVGRFDLGMPTMPTAEWSGSSMEARFSGTAASVQLGGSGNYFAVVVDGTVGPVLETNGGSSYPVATGLSGGEHDVLVFRRDEAFDNPTQFLGFTFPDGGALLPPPVAPAHRIELIGDSISAGYGDECANVSTPFSSATENEYIAYGALTARALAADLHVVAWSGKGMYQNVDGTQTDTMPILWQRTIPTDATSVWNPAQWIPDAVVINLGTNDYNAPGADPSTSYQAAYLQFVTTLRGAYPEAYIFCAMGPLLGGTPLANALAAVNNVIAARHTAGDMQIGLVQFATQMCNADGTGCGCQYHPDATTHQAMATVLEAKIRSTLGW